MNTTSARLTGASVAKRLRSSGDSVRLAADREAVALVIVTLIHELDSAERETARLRTIIDGRPAINAGLPETYIEWSRGVYLTDDIALRHQS